MTKDILLNLSVQYAIDAVKFCKTLTEHKEYILSKQLLRSATSIGANLHEAKYAQSRADFINKLQISLKECHETEFWLTVISNSSCFKEVEAECIGMIRKAGQIRWKLISSLKTTKNLQ